MQMALQVPTVTVGLIILRQVILGMIKLRNRAVNGQPCPTGYESERGA